MAKRQLQWKLAAIVALCGGMALMTSCNCYDDNAVETPTESMPSYEHVLDFFDEVTKIPRPNKHEEKMVEYLIDFAKERNLEYWVDGKNIVIYKDATEGMEQAPGVVLQAHTDMICVAADGYDVDFMTQGIEAVNDGIFIHSKDYKTSLGADDGIGIAIILAVLDSHDIKHGPLECLFTWDEEDEFSGATSFPAGFLKGQYMFNIDWEEEGELCIGTAGGVEVDVSLAYDATAVPADYVALKLSLKNLAGGHSGVAINDGGANAITLLAEFMHQKADDMRLVSMRGGTYVNVIATSATATVVVPEAKKQAFVNSWNQYMTANKELYATTDPEMDYCIEDVYMPTTCLTEADTKAIVAGISAAPQGVIEWSTTIDNMFETSNNIGVVSVDASGFYAEYLLRGFDYKKIDDLATTMELTYTNLNPDFKCQQVAPFMPWNPDIDSPLMQYAQNVYQQCFGRSMKLRKVGGGLEVSEFTQKYPDMQFISYGPTIYDAHSVNERVDIKSISNCWYYTLNLLICDLSN